jgi:hypothetical protein
MEPPGFPMLGKSLNTDCILQLVVVWINRYDIASSFLRDGKMAIDLRLTHLRDAAAKRLTPREYVP